MLDHDFGEGCMYGKVLDAPKRRRERPALKEKQSKKTVTTLVDAVRQTRDSDDAMADAVRQNPKGNSSYSIEASPFASAKQQ